VGVGVGVGVRESVCERVCVSVCVCVYVCVCVCACIVYSVLHVTQKSGATSEGIESKPSSLLKDSCVTQIFQKCHVKHTYTPLFV